MLGSLAGAAFLGEFYRGWDDALRQPCTVCAARGVHRCPQLEGLESVPAGKAFDWAFGRTGARVLVDSSKVTDWIQTSTAGSATLDIAIVHLVRDPRGWLASRRRRAPSLETGWLIRHWLDRNTAILAFADRHGYRHGTFLYDALSNDPVRGFGRLAKFCALRFDKAALHYWNFEHHGFAANGATSAALPEGAPVDALPHFVTGDDAFYAEHRKRLFSDARWRSELSTEDIARVGADSGVAEFLSACGVVMTEESARKACFFEKKKQITFGRFGFDLS